MGERHGLNFKTNIDMATIYGYKITQGQKNSIENQKFAPNQYFNPVQDINGDWFIFDAEMEYAVKNKGWAKQPKEEYIAPDDGLGDLSI